MIRGIKGVKDILPDHIPRWDVIETTAHRLARNYGFREIRVPVFEQTDLYVRSIGGTTDIVEKEMYTFGDRDGTSLTLRPEGTAGVVRAYIEHNLGVSPTSKKLYYLGPMFRHERPQAGRFRQFHQFGVEAFGSESPHLDTEVVSLLWRFFSTLGVPGLTLHLNTLGQPAERQVFTSALLDFLKNDEDQLCANCRRRMTTNPLRVLDCKVPGCQQVTQSAPMLTDYLSEPSREHFREVCHDLDLMNIPYILNPRLVRGLDYYGMTTFEVTCSSLGAQNAIGAGGRYDGLVKALGGSPTPAVGFAVGLERLALVLPETALFPSPPIVFVAAFGEKGRPLGIKLLETLRAAGVIADTDYQASSLKAYLRSADRLGASFTIILGDDEAAQGYVILRNMLTKMQENLPFDGVAEVIATRLHSPGMPSHSLDSKGSS